MKRIKSIIIFFILLFVFAKWGPSINFSTTTSTRGEPFIVSGEGKVTVSPDIAKVDFGIQENGQVLKQVQDDVNKKSKTLVDAIKKLGIEESDIKTISYNVYPQYDYNSQTQQITGYQVSTSYEITVRDFTKINELIGNATSWGANTIGGVNFDLSDELKTKTLKEARELAVKEAKSKASGLAGAAGISLGKIINISENNQSGIRPMAYAVSGGGVADKEITPPSVQVGTTEINVAISLSYELK